MPPNTLSFVTKVGYNCDKSVKWKQQKYGDIVECNEHFIGDNEKYKVV